MRLQRASGRKHLVIILLSLALFVLALELIQQGISSIEPLVLDVFQVSNVVNALGFGWFLAYILLSGSPAAALALALLDEGTTSPSETYMMIAGTRLGSSLFVLLVGGYYAWREHERRGLEIGILSFIVVATIQIPALGLGYLLLEGDILEPITFQIEILESVDYITASLVEPLQRWLPDLVVVIIGMLLLILAFRLFDYTLSRAALDAEDYDLFPRLLSRPWALFGVGMVVTLLTLSVTISLGILVPLTTRGLIRRERLIPYVMGCNITTYLDTLLIAMLLGTATGLTVTLAIILSTMVVAVGLLLVGFKRYQSGVNGLVDWILDDTWHLVVFVVPVMSLPLLLLLI